MKCFTLHVMNLEYMKVSLFEIIIIKKLFHDILIFELHLYIYIYTVYIYIYIYIYIHSIYIINVSWAENQHIHLIFQIIYIRGGTVHVFVPNRHGTGISVRCMMPYDEYRQFTPQQCNTVRRTANANGDTHVWLTVFYFDKVPTGCQVSNAGTDVFYVCVCVCACSGAITSTVSLYQQNQL